MCFVLGCGAGRVRWVRAGFEDGLERDADVCGGRWFGCFGQAMRWCFVWRGGCWIFCLLRRFVARG